MVHEDAATRARSGRVIESQVAFERPDTVVRSSNGDMFALPRRQAHVPVYQKTNARLLDPATGQRRQYGKRAGPAAPKPFMSFTTFALTAFVGYKAVQTLWRLCRGRQQQQQVHLLDASEEEEDWQQQQMRALPSTQQQQHNGPSAFLRRALPTLGPPRRAKRMAAQHKQQRAAAAAAVQRAAGVGASRGGRAAGRQRVTQPVHERRRGMLEKWEAVLKQQQAAAAAQLHHYHHQQQQHAAAAGLGLPGSRAPGSSSTISSTGGLPLTIPTAAAAAASPDTAAPLLQMVEA